MTTPAPQTADAGAAMSSRSTDILASLVVFLVALPLCLGVAIASGAPPALGLITGIIGGIVVGSIAGSPLQVSGPAAGMAVLVYQLVSEQGLIMLGIVGLIAGALQLTAGALKLGQWFRAISPSVIHGMLAGIGVLILASQFHVMLDDAPRKSGLENLAAMPGALFRALFTADSDSHRIAALLGFSSIAIIFAWDKFKPAKLRMIPAPLIAVIFATLVAVLLDLPIKRIDVPSSLLGSLNIPTAAAFARMFEPEILILGAVFAFVASAETLLCATAVDQMHTGVRTNYDKELRAQGVGNLLCGAVGALPMTGVIVRSGANVTAGAKTRLSTILHGTWLLVTVAALPWLLNAIPTAALGAILVFTGYKLLNIAQMKKIASFGRTEIGIYAATLIGIVTISLLAGVVIGFALATAKLLYGLSHVGVETRVDAAARRTDITLTGAATFFAIPKLGMALEQVIRGHEVHVHIDQLGHIDHACLDLLANWRKQHEATGGTLILDWQALSDQYNAQMSDNASVAMAGPRG